MAQATSVSALDQALFTVIREASGFEKVLGELRASDARFSEKASLAQRYIAIMAARLAEAGRAIEDTDAVIAPCPSSDRPDEGSFSTTSTGMAGPRDGQFHLGARAASAFGSDRKTRLVPRVSQTVHCEVASLPRTVGGSLHPEQARWKDKASTWRPRATRSLS